LPDDDEARALRARVEEARRPLPTPVGELQAVLAEVSGSGLSQGLSAIEEVRGSILDALDEGEEDAQLDGTSPRGEETG
jgi:hypothetical protein